MLVHDIMILQDDQIYLNHFEKSVTGTAHLLPAAPRRRTLFIPEVLVEKVPKVSLDLKRDQYGGDNQRFSDPSARPHQGVTYPSDVHADATSAGEGPVDHNLGKGSLIQIPAPDSTHPMQYGTIKWTGLLPHAVGEIAGIELVK